MGYKFGIRLDAGKKIGTGHLMRCMALAECLRENGHEIIFICRNKLYNSFPYKVDYIELEYSSLAAGYHFPSILDEIVELDKILIRERFDCLIIDHYGAVTEYYDEIRKYCEYIVAIDDIGGRVIFADCVINGNIYATKMNYPGIKECLLGTDFLLLRKEFESLERKHIYDSIENVYITSGGADPLRFCYTIASAMNEISLKGLNVHIVIGPDFDREYEKWFLQYKDLILEKDLNMLESMKMADIYITSAGSTMYELAACGVPSICYELAPDQEFIAKEMNDMGCVISLGKFSEFDSETFKRAFTNVANDVVLRKSLSERCRALINGGGARVVASKLCSFLERVHAV